MTVAEVVSLSKDVLVGVAALVTSSIAVIGLKSWARELRGKAAFDVARALAKSTYRLRDEIEVCRSPFVAVSEFPRPEANNVRTEGRRADDLAYAFANRWNRVMAAVQEFDSSTLEAEALWGPSIRATTDEFRACLGELRAAMEAYIDDCRDGGGIFRSDPDFAKKIKAKIWANDRATNEFTRRLVLVVAGIDKALLPHLRRV